MHGVRGFHLKRVYKDQHCLVYKTQEKDDIIKVCEIMHGIAKSPFIQFASKMAMHGNLKILTVAGYYIDLYVRKMFNNMKQSKNLKLPWIKKKKKFLVLCVLVGRRWIFLFIGTALTTWPTVKWENALLETSSYKQSDRN